MVKKVHFANLNSLRFIAAFIVIIHHTEQIKFIRSLPNSWNTAVVPILGKLGVDLFFVLSGFLITSLLFIEKDLPTGISIKNFIIRRLLRIWPLYFIIMILGFFIMPNFPDLQLGNPFINVNDHFSFNISMYLLFIPYVQLIMFGPVLYSSQAWSIGIEEQFYIIWPFIIKYYNQKKIINFIVIYIVVYLFISLSLTPLSHNKFITDNLSLNFLNKLSVFIREILKFDCLLIGGAFAIINNRINKDSIFVSKYFQVFIYLIEAMLVYTGKNFNGFSWEIHAVLYGFIIINLVRTETSIININYPVFDYLGKISYGMYMYHILIINLTINLLSGLNLMVLAYPVIFILVILVSALSYKYIEGYFLKKKEYFSSLSTG